MVADHAEGHVNEAPGQRRGRWATGTGAVAALTAAAALLAVSLAACGGDDDAAAGGDGDRRPTTTEAAPPEAEPADGGAPSTLASTPSTTAPAASPGVGPDTPLSRSGIGPIRAGMTLRQAEEAAGVTITPGEPIGPGSTCLEAQIEGADIWLQLRTSGAPGEDVGDGIVTVVSGEDARSTEEGVAVGDPVAEVTEAYGTATRTADHPYVSGGQILVYTSGEHSYGIFTDGSTVVSLQSGAADGVPSLEGCA